MTPTPTPTTSYVVDSSGTSSISMYTIGGVILSVIVIAYVTIRRCCCQRPAPAQQYYAYEAPAADQPPTPVYTYPAVTQAATQSYKPTTASTYATSSTRTTTGHSTPSTTPAVAATDVGAFNMSDLEMFRISVADVTVVKTLASGGYGVVSLATLHGARVALKKLTAEKESSSDDVAKFIAEIRLMTKMSSPFIVGFVGVVWTRPTDVMLVTEFMDAGDLRDVLQSQESLLWATKLSIAFDIVQGLVYLHTLEPKVLHRDLKSRNVLLNTNMTAKLTDFGISRELDDATMTAGIGTYRWMAPEVLREGHYDESADIYALGVLLTELDTHDLPYANLRNASGRPYTDTAIMAKVMAGEFRPSFSHASPAWYQELGVACMSQDPTLRPTALQAASTLHREVRRLEG
ncbi:TKL protein kinase [Saprolegnia diclina VS20]|uniref:TKL protein kinase n=1 Tax=Saprolegnia diclina (strain VS20) TaxID=1156394 RepID=T0QJ39_SAPDV|nr:TKL protein kinase [Saprolegnia diclina VS20]EQC37999.1 TKL protein kinase [Saprolegnia diclina VS20]|eukprot:XP_008608326.1 TKL protein kinase [Saprolegnia diclina VS20]